MNRHTTPLSLFGQNLASGSGIEDLMHDLGHALAEGGSHIHMLGGGNPAFIPAVDEVWKQRMREIVADDGTLRRVLGVYDPPRGNAAFLSSVAGLLEKEYGWPVGPENLAITSGSQTAFFYLFHLLAGPASERAEPMQILFPVMPEYIGYAAQQASPGMFCGRKPLIQSTGPHSFKYHVDFDHLDWGDRVAAVCVSRPTNPSGNVLDDAEMEKLSRLCAQKQVPLIIDNAYGLPFPGILFSEATPMWAPHHIFVFSLSKLGLPGTRTAVVVADPDTAARVASLTAVTGLANGNFGQAIVRPLLEDGKLLRMVSDNIRPFYQAKRDHAREVAARELPEDLEYSLHETQGAMFLWLWLKDCPVSSAEMYQRLKARNVLVVPGEQFFFGLPSEDRDWRHRKECLRISYAMDHSSVEIGLKILGEEVRGAYLKK